MPIYEYECSECGNVEEAFQKISEAPLEICNHCSGKLNKIVSQSSFHLKGSGWYVTDYGGSKSTTDKTNGTTEAKTDKSAKSEAASNSGASSSSSESSSK